MIELKGSIPLDSLYAKEAKGGFSEGGLERKTYKPDPELEKLYGPQSEVKELPLWADIGLGAVSYGATAAALAVTTGGPGVIATSALAAPIYMAAKYALTGQKPKSSLLSQIPGAEGINSTALGTVEEMALWAAVPTILKPAFKAGGAAVRGIQKVSRPLTAPFEKAYKPVGEAVWKVVKFPTQIQLPKVNKSLAEMLQPAVDRLEEKIPKAALKFRAARVEQNLTNSLGKELSDKMSKQSPETLYEVAKGLRRGGQTGGLKDKQAKAIIKDLNKDLKQLKLDKHYEGLFRSNLSKINFIPADDFAPSVIKKLATPEKASIKEIHGVLRSVIENPRNSDKTKALAKDLWALPAKTVAGVSQASREATMEVLKSKIAETPRVFTTKLRPGYVEGKSKAFKGAFIHKDVDLEFQAMEKLPKIAEGLWNKFFMTPWKTNKIVLRPATHMRNIMSNALLNDWGGLPFWRMDIYSKALHGLRNPGKELTFKQFSRMTGGQTANFAAADLQLLGAKTTYDSNILERMLSVYDKAVAPARSLYGAEETFFKYAKYLHNLERGMSKKPAAHDAMKWTFNYSEITPEVANVGKYAIPFVRWFSKSIPLGLETIVKHPVRVGKWLGFYQALQATAVNQTGITEQEWGQLEKMMPEYLQKGLYLLMPFRDESGLLNMMDLTYTIPFFGDVSELMSKAPAESILQNPIFTMASTFLTKRKFSGAPLYYDWEDPSMKFTKTMAYAWEQLMPAVSPGGPDWKNLYNAFTEQPDSMSPEVALANSLGVKLVPVDDMLNRRRKKNIMSLYRREIRSSLRQELKKTADVNQHEKVIERHRRFLKGVLSYE